MTTVTRRYHFCASHRLHSSSLSEAENERLYGKCNNPYGHGHDYSFGVSVTGNLDDTTGLIVRVSDLDCFVQTEVLSRFAYRNLNTDIEEFRHLVPTTENVATVIAGMLEERWASYFPYSFAHLSSISIQETDRNSFEVALPARTLQHAAVESRESVVLNA